MTQKRRTAGGFSLVELSIVLVVVGILTSSAMVPLGASLEARKYQQTQKQLQDVRHALHGFLAAHGRLPCPVALLDAPASAVYSSRFLPGDNSAEPLAAEVCAVSHGGVPTGLGVPGYASASNVLLDSWGRPLRYAVTQTDNAEAGSQGKADWITAGELSAVGASRLSADLVLCRNKAAQQCVNRDLIATDIVWVVVSDGNVDTALGVQAENQDNDDVFAVSSYSINKAQPFDDLLVWGSRSELVYWLLRANWLP